MSEQTVLEFLKDTITSMTDEELDLSATTPVADIGLESIDQVDLVEQIEKRYAIKIDSRDIEGLAKGSLGNVARFILSRVQCRR